MDFKSEFATVELILNSKFETRGVDAFALSLIKAEKQMRRVFVYLIFQNPVYSYTQSVELRKTLANNKKLYFKGFLYGINLILIKPLKEIYGEEFDKDLLKIMEYTKDRNKIFHGQITAQGLSREDLIHRVNHIKKWCETLGRNLEIEMGYNGFSASSRKCSKQIQLRNLDKFDTIKKYENFLNELQ